MNPLHAPTIAAALHCGEVYLFDEIDSTNAYLLTHAAQFSSGSICLAECQTAGRGRRGRQWYSPQGKNLYFSLLWKYPQPLPPSLSALSLIVALEIAETFEALGIEVQIKWPNDIYYQGKKAGGILIESKCDQQGAALVIGIGLNLAMTTVDSNIVNQPWTDFASFSLNRNQLAVDLAARLQRMLNAFLYHELRDLLARWPRFDCFYQKPVKLLTSQGEIKGIAQGINEQGELLLADDKGDCHAFAIGELSLRAVTE